MPKKNKGRKEKRKSKSTFKRKDLDQNKSNKPNMETKKNTQNNGQHTWRNIWNASTWLTGGFLAMIGLFPAITDSILNKVTPTWLFIFIFVASCVWLCNLLWLVTKFITKRYLINNKVRIAIVAGLGIIIIIFTLPFYVGFFIGNRGTIDMPEYIDKSQEVSVALGTGTQGFILSATISQLENGPVSFFQNNKGQDLFTIQIKGKKLYVNTNIYNGLGKEPVGLDSHNFDNLPSNWDINQDKTGLEVLNGDKIPIFIMKYKNPYSLFFEGIFSVGSEMYAVPDKGGLEMGPSLPYTFTAKKIFIRSFMDIIRPQRTYVIR